MHFAAGRRTIFLFVNVVAVTPTYIVVVAFLLLIFASVKYENMLVCSRGQTTD